jgi:hypothetical protein
MPHSRVIQHLNDEVGYGVADQAISTSQACRESHARCADKYWIRAYKERLLGDSRRTSADKYKTHLSQHRTSILDKHAL